MVALLGQHREDRETGSFDSDKMPKFITKLNLLVLCILPSFVGHQTSHMANLGLQPPAAVALPDHGEETTTTRWIIPLLLP